MNTELSPAAALLAQIEAQGGKLTVMTSGQLWCEGIPEGFKPRLIEYHIQLVSLLLRQTQPEKLTKPALKKLICTIEAHGGSFHKCRNILADPPSSIELPDSLVNLKPLILANAAELFAVKFPKPRKQSCRPKKHACIVCKTGTGCRMNRYAYRDQFLSCPRCEHPCYLHFEGTHQQLADGGRWDTPNGCNHWQQIDDETYEKVKCDCIGWPLPPAQPAQPKAGRKTKSAAQLLLPDAMEAEDTEELEELTN